MAVGFTPLTASATFAFSSSVNAAGSATTVNDGAWIASDSFDFSILVSDSSLGFSSVAGAVFVSATVVEATVTAGAT